MTSQTIESTDNRYQSIFTFVDSTIAGTTRSDEFHRYGEWRLAIDEQIVNGVPVGGD